MDRHARQSRLVGVGVEGQARIGRCTVDVGLEGLSADVAVRYLAGAGVGRLRVRSAALARAAHAVDAGVGVDVNHLLPESPSPVLGLDDPAAAQLASGALFALRALRAGLEGRP